VAKALTLRRNSGGVVERRITSWRNIDIFWQRHGAVTAYARHDVRRIADVAALSPRAVRPIRIQPAAG
jgi:hypothetical protein